MNFLVTSADNLVTLVFFYLTQVYPLPEIDPRLHPPQDAISGLRGANAVGSVINCHGNPAFVVELFSRENSEVCTTQPGQELQIMVCFVVVVVVLVVVLVVFLELICAF